MDEELRDLGVSEALCSEIKKCLSGRPDRWDRDAGELGTNGNGISKRCIQDPIGSVMRRFWHIDRDCDLIVGFGRFDCLGS